MAFVCGFLEPGAVANAFLCVVAVRRVSFEPRNALILLAPRLIAKESAIAAKFRTERNFANEFCRIQNATWYDLRFTLSVFGAYSLFYAGKTHRT